MICPGCHTLNFRDYKFCRECGRKLEPPVPAPAALDPEPGAGGDGAQVQMLLDQAFQAFDAGNLSDAAMACQGALALRPESTAAHSLLGLIYEKQGQIPDAIQQYRIVLQLNPSSHADRAKLEELLRDTGQANPSLLGRLRAVRSPALAGSAAAVLVLVTGLFVVARSATPRREELRRAEPPRLQTTLAPSAPVAAEAPMPSPPPAAPASPNTAVGAIPRRTMTNGTPPRVAQAGVAAPALPPRPRPAARRAPSFLAPAPIRGLSGVRRDLAAGQPGGTAPVLPDAGAPASSPPVSAPPAYAPPAEPAAPPILPGDAGGSSINIRRLDGSSPPAPPAAPPPAPAPATPPEGPSLAEARQHYNAAGELLRRGDYAGAYREFEYARELFRMVNNRGGTEGLLAAEGVVASHRAMQQLSAGRR